MKIDFPGGKTHEFAITESILEIVQSEAAQANARQVDTIRVVVGELSTFVEESIEIYFRELARGTVAENAQLSFSKLEARAVCNGCGADFRPGNAFFSCPECKSAFCEIRQGQELFIESIEIPEKGESDTEGG